MADGPQPGRRYDVARGASLDQRTGAASLHTLRYEFKRTHSVGAREPPADLRVNSSQGTARLKLASRGRAGSAAFSGKAEPHKATDFALICDADGQWRLERLGHNIKNLIVEPKTKGREGRSVPPPAPAAPAAAPAAAEPAAAPAACEPSPATRDSDVSVAALFGDDDDSQPAAQ